MWKKIKNAYRVFGRDKPGERFANAHSRWKGGSWLRTAAMILAGVILIVIGFFLGLVPGVPGIVLAVLGGALIATRFRGMARGLDWMEIKCRRVWDRCRQRFAPTKPIN